MSGGDSPERLRRIRTLFDAVLDLPASEREAYLARETAGDAELRREVGALVDSAEHTEVPFGLTPDQRIADAGPSLVGQRLGRYDVIRLIGTGGMGAVYEAVRADDQYRQRVAIKMVQQGFDTDLTIARFRRERQILASLTHPNIATLLDGGVSADGRPFLVMEYVEGDPITHWCDARALPIRERLALFRQVCSAVQHAHLNLVIHRDLKPGNILVTPDGAVKLLDFGIAKLLVEEPADDGLPLTRGGARMLTPEYASPEQLQGLPLTTVSDVYSLGVLLFELLAGCRPHRADGRPMLELEREILEGDTPRASALVTAEAARARGERSVDRLRHQLRGDLDQIVAMALRKEPLRRYASVEALADDVRRHLDGLPVRAQRDWAGYRLTKFVQRNRAASVISLLLLCSLVAGVITTSVQARHARLAQAKSERVNDFLRTILSSVRPATGGRDVPVSEVLDTAAQRLAVELRDAPEVRLDLERVVSQSYSTLGRLDEAEQHMREAMQLAAQTSGPHSAEMVSTIADLGSVLAAQGDYPRADSVLRSALSLFERAEIHDDTLHAYLFDQLGSTAHYMGEVKQSEAYHRQALTIRERVLGQNDDLVARSLNNVAVALGDQGKWPESEALQRRAIAILEHNHPGPNTLVTDGLNTLAGMLDFEGKTASAESMYLRVLALRKQLLGAQHPDYAYTLFNYSMFIFDQGRYQEAADYSRQILALRGHGLPESHVAIAAALQTLGRCLDKLGRTAEAEAPLKESVELRKKYNPPDSWLIASSEGVLAEHYTLVHEYARAEPLLLHSEAVFEKTFGVSGARTQANLKRLVALYRAWGRPDRTAAYQKLVADSTP